jgi:release factor glutamine methyltransferase
MKGVPYIASDDSALLRSVLRGKSGARCLEIGAGNGGNLIELVKSFEVVVGTDLVEPSMRDWSRAGAQYVLADRAGCLVGEAFDLVLFNPPYLPSDGIEDVAVDEGDGRVPLDFLREALRAVKDDGKVLFLLRDGEPLGVFQDECKRRGFTLVKVAGAHLFYENLSVYEAGRGAGN